MVKRTLGIAVVGIGGAVGTTMAAGVALLKKGVIDTPGLPLAGMPVDGLADYTDIVFAGWDMFGEHLAGFELRRGWAGFLLAKQSLRIAEAGGVAAGIEFETAREQGLGVLESFLTKTNFGQHLHRPAIGDIAGQMGAQEVIGVVQPAFKQGVGRRLEDGVAHRRPRMLGERRLRPGGIPPLEELIAERPPGVS